MITEYITISKTGRSLFKDRGSKFIGIALHAATEMDVKLHLEAMRAEFHDARHQCYAFVLGADKAQFRANDDGEPNHSAGDPILGQIHSKNLTNTLVVVIRYFGGTKLGVSGLINAYKQAAEEALTAATIEKVTVKKSVKLSYPYEATNDVMRLVSDFSIDIKDQRFETECTLEGEISIDQYDQFVAKIELLKNLGTEVRLREWCG